MTFFPDPARVAAIMAETAAEEILPRFRNLDDADIREKSPGELVTVADEASEARLTERLADLLPGSRVVGEEAVGRDAALLEILKSDDPVWIIDPLDGTSNFAAGHASFAVIVALVVGGATVAGWIYDPNRPAMAIAENGSGAYLDGAPMLVSVEPELANMRAIITLRYFSGDLLEGVRRLEAAVAKVTPFSCAGLAYLDLCSGAAEIATPARLRPWDHAAGALMHLEAGGHNALSDARPYSPKTSEGLFIVAPHEAAWTAVHDLMFR